MIEIIEQLNASRNLLEVALDKYVNACCAVQNYCMRGTPFDDVFEQVTHCAANELPTFISCDIKLQKAKAAIGTARNYSPSVLVNALPFEILSRIFKWVLRAQICADEYDSHTKSFELPKYPALLSHVCSHWRRIAIGTHVLWSYINLAPRHPASKRLLARAQIHATRSSQSPLQIRLFDPTPDPPTVVEDEEDGLVQFLASIAARISSLQLSTQSPLENFHYSVLRSCFLNAVPGIFTRFILWDGGVDVRQSHTFIEGSENPNQPGSTLRLPKQLLEDLLLPVIDLKLCGTFLHWTSIAYHGLVELHLHRRLGSHAAPPITEFQVFEILASSPGLRIVHFGLQITESRPEETQTIPARLEELEILNLIEMDYDQLGRFLRLLTTGSKMSRLSFSPPVSFSVTSSIAPFDDDVRDFFARLSVSKLCVFVFGGSTLFWVHKLYELAPHLHVLILDQFSSMDLFVNSIPPPINHDDLARHPSTDHLYLIRCHVPLKQLQWVLKTYTIRRLTVWQSVISGNTGMARVRKTLSQDCPVVDILPDSAPDPVVDWY